MARKKLALTDDQVTEIVQAINASQGLSYYQLTSGVITKEALAPLAERYDVINAEIRAADRQEYLKARANLSTSYRDGSERNRALEMRLGATGVILRLGHQYPAFQGANDVAYECATCGATGTASDDLRGSIFKERCK